MTNLSVLSGQREVKSLHFRRRHLVLLSPIGITLIGQIAARIVGPPMGVWSWVPLILGYWLAAGLLVFWFGGKVAISRWLQPSQGSWLWRLLALIFAVTPTLPMLHEGLHFFSETKVWIPTIFFVIVNPCIEEGYWRGLLIDAATESEWRRWVAILYSSVLFALNHSWMAVIIIGAGNPVAIAFQFMFALVMSIVYLKTQSLRLPIVAHFLTNLLTPTGALLLNLYVPAQTI